VLQRVFDLTHAEVRLAQGIARGDSLEEIAGGLRIKISTARTQLASIFAKTQTRRQAKLVALLGGLSWSFLTAVAASGLPTQQISFK